METRISWNKETLKDAEELKNQIRTRKAYKVLFVLREANDAVVANVIAYAVKRGWRITNPERGIIGVEGAVVVSDEERPHLYYDDEPEKEDLLEWFPEVIR